MKEFLNKEVLEVVEFYPEGGGYTWDKNSPDDGVTQDLYYLEKQVAETRGTTYCCGLTFEIYLRACELYARKNNGIYTLQGVDKNIILDIKRDWYVATPGFRGGPVDALGSRGLAIMVPIQQAQAGDFIQFWRRGRTGHSAIVLDVTQEGVEYFSTQPSTDGIGRRTEYFTGSNPIDETYVARALVPEVGKKLPVIEDGPKG